MTKPEFHVDVRLADYGISRMSLPSGTKGFGGTPPFIAPEILQHAGKDIYTDKVNCKLFIFLSFTYFLFVCLLENTRLPTNIYIPLVLYKQYLFFFLLSADIYSWNYS